MDHSVVYAADNAFLGDLLVNREVEETVEEFGLSIDSSADGFVVRGGGDRLGSLTVSSRSCISRSPLGLRLEA